MDKQLIVKFFWQSLQNFSIIFLYFIKYYFYEKFLGFKNKNYMFFLAQIAITLMGIFIAGLLSETSIILISLIFELIVVCVMCKGKILIKFYAVILNQTSLLLITLMFLIVDFKVSPVLLKLFANSNNYKMVNCIMLNLSDLKVYLIAFSFFKYICGRLKIKEKDINTYKILILIIPCMSIYSMAFLFYTIQGVKINKSRYFLFSLFTNAYYVLPLICAFLLVSISIMAYTFDKMIYMEEENEKLILMRQKLQLQLEHTRHIEEINTKIKAVIHDVNNHVACLKNLADNDKNDEIKKYLGNIKDSLGKLEFKIKTGNSIADAVINEKANVAEMKKIDFECEFILPRQINIEPIDLSIILNNILDNAIEACARIENKNIVKKISMKSFITDSYLIIEISNSNIGKIKYIDNTIISSKINKINHGIGVSNIKSVVSKYGGVFDIVQEKYKVTVNVMLKLYT